LSIKAITFDFWSTLYKAKTVDYSERIARLKEKVERRSGLSFEMSQFEAAVQTARDTWSRTWTVEHRTITANEWLEIVLRELGSALDLDHLFDIKTGMENRVLSELPTLVPEAKTVLADLAADYRLAIISDTGLTPGRVLRQILEQDSIIDYFTHLTFSDEIGRSKPHPDAFLTTLDALEAEPQAAVHVGDLLRTDIAGAQNVGMRAIQYVGLLYKETILGKMPKPEITPDAIIKNHTELKPLLRQWNGAGIHSPVLP
jgi:FMN phosphatase YigB (HAD superfamily)